MFFLAGPNIKVYIVELETILLCKVGRRKKSKIAIYFIRPWMVVLTKRVLEMFFVCDQDDQLIGDILVLSKRYPPGN